MTTSAILEKLQPLFRDVLDVPDLELTEDLSAKDVPEWDSLNHVRIISAVEKNFSVRLTSSELEKSQNVGDLAQLVSTKIAT